MEGIELPNQESIRTTKEKESYKKKAKNNRIGYHKKPIEMKKKRKKEGLQRNKKTSQNKTASEISSKK